MNQYTWHSPFLKFVPSHLSPVSPFLWLIPILLFRLIQKNPLQGFSESKDWDHGSSVFLYSQILFFIITRNHILHFLFTCFSLPLDCRIPEASNHILFSLAFLELSTIPVNSRCLKCLFPKWMGGFSAILAKQIWLRHIPCFREFTSSEEGRMYPEQL